MVFSSSLPGAALVVACGVLRLGQAEGSCQRIDGLFNSPISKLRCTSSAAGGSTEFHFGNLLEGGASWTALVAPGDTYTYYLGLGGLPTDGYTTFDNCAPEQNSGTQNPWLDTQVAAQTGGIDSPCYAIGSKADLVTEVNWAYDDSSGTGLLTCLVESIPGNTASRKSYIQFSCDCSKSTPVLTAQGETEPGAYYFNVAAKGACPTEGKGSCGGGGDTPGEEEAMHAGDVLVILFFVGLAGYLVGGVVYNVKKNAKSGLEALPHRDFWMTIPLLSKDGMAFSWKKTKEWAAGFKKWVDGKRGVEYETL